MKKIILTAAALVFMATGASAQTVQRSILLQAKLMSAQEELTNLSALRTQITSRIKNIQYEYDIAKNELEEIAEQQRVEANTKKQAEIDKAKKASKKGKK